MKDVDSGIIRGGRKERVAFMVGHSLQGMLVVPQGPVRFNRQVQVIPRQAIVLHITFCREGTGQRRCCKKKVDHCARLLVHKHVKNRKSSNHKLDRADTLL